MSITNILDDFRNKRIFVVGDIMLDRYIFGTVDRISPEAPVPILKVNKEIVMPGGSANVAANLKTLGASVKLFGSVGTDIDADELMNLIGSMGIETDGIIKQKDVPTTVKTRLIAINQQITRIDKELVQPIDIKLSDNLSEAIASSIKQDPPDAIIISDYAKGLITHSFCQALIRIAKESSIIIAVDPKGSDFEKYRGATVITPNVNEAAQVCGIKIENDDSLNEAFKSIFDSTASEAVLITRGKYGISYSQQRSPIITVNSKAREIFDVTGAGDTVISSLVLSYLSSKSWSEAVIIANYAAGIVVGRVGAGTVTIEDLEEEINRAEVFETVKKYVKNSAISDVAASCREKGLKVIFTNGCFDLFHHGHLKLLSDSKKLGDALFVGINSDASVKRLKGAGRPVVPEHERVNILSALECVDYVVIFDEDTPLKLIKNIKPDVIVKGGDYLADQVVGKEFVESYGGRVHIVPIVEGVSTTSLISQIKSEIKANK